MHLVFSVRLNLQYPLEQRRQIVPYKRSCRLCSLPARRPGLSIVFGLHDEMQSDIPVRASTGARKLMFWLTFSSSFSLLTVASDVKRSLDKHWFNLTCCFLDWLLI